MRTKLAGLVTAGMLLASSYSACAWAGPSELDNAALRRQVIATERAFAASMANRDFDAFKTFLSDEAIFYAGNGILRGKEAVADAWKPFFDGAEAPFSWAPDRVSVLTSGTLAHSSGPVKDPAGQVTGRFNSVWRQEGQGRWRIVFDKGEDVCNCRQQAGARPEAMVE
ncbi:ketosteroid isomerase-like protein [Pseudoduganella flava]|uniref:Ketosteroid isomerase-like protein n=2 Tax=Pseudoduganella flava TaxID=871742 RepID=A0A562PI06_9BURK|nr:nuclear transport factor 2 family protein [Pseudoduganella flava]TWI44071.1 ketosteroid isomerase-like protein [Pseudoduganella flava]